MHTTVPSSKSRIHEERNLVSILSIAFFLTATFMLIEFMVGLYTQSLALIADASHMLVDALALGVALLAVWLSSRPATADKTFGFYRIEILAALLNGLILIMIALGIFYESFHRFYEPPEIKTEWMIATAVVGLFVNLINAYFLYGSQSISLNVRAAFLHVTGDAIGSIGAIFAGILMKFKGWYIADPIVSMAVGVLIIYNAGKLVRDSINILLESTPGHINLETIHQELCNVEGVRSIHDLHVWTLTSGFYAMSCHAVLTGEGEQHQILKELRSVLNDKFEVKHSTIQLEEKSLEDQEDHFCHSTSQF